MEELQNQLNDRKERVHQLNDMRDQMHQLKDQMHEQKARAKNIPFLTIDKIRLPNLKPKKCNYRGTRLNVQRFWHLKEY